MTTILPAARSPWQVLDQAIGQQVGQNLPGAVERGYERGQIQQGLNQIKNLSPEQVSQMSPHQLLASVLGPFAGTRQGAQYAEAILPTLEKLITKNQLFPNGIGGNPAQAPSMYRGYEGSPGIAENFSQPQAQQPGMNFDQAAQAAQAGNQAFQYKPPGQGTPQTDQAKTETPTLPPGTKTVQEMLQEASNSSDPFKVIDFWAKINNYAKDQRNELYKEYLRNFEKEENRINRENSFRGFAEGATQKKYNADDFNRLIRYSDKYISEPTQTSRLYHAERDLQKYNNAIGSLEKARKAPGFFENLFRGQGMATKELESAFKPLVELGEIDKAKELSAGLGLGPIQSERIINPLPKQTKNILNQVKNAPSSINRPGAPYSTAAAEKQGKAREASLSKLPDIISKAIKEGGDMTSLKLIRNDLYQKGYLEHEFATALKQALQNGLKLSDYQKTEQSELGRRVRRPFMDILFSDDTIGPGEEALRTLRGFE